ncbi:MAG: DUF1284 domain-containing protein [Myxococcota bacterium]|nr:DUF1284 domain-containing protein [Myxococcota bacterium]
MTIRDNLTDGSKAKRAVRAHTAICMQGFVGRGYSPAFVEKFSEILTEVQSGVEFKLTARPDDICRACPHGQASECTLHSRNNEPHIVEQDLRVLNALGYSDGDTTNWSSLVQRIGQSIIPDDLDTICGDCPWLPMGMCKSALQRLRQHHPER